MDGAFQVFVDVSLIEMVFKFHRRLVAQGAVEPLWVIKGFDVIKDLESGFSVGGWQLRA